jgi:uncharacterized protein (TIGR00266 family)
MKRLTTTIIGETLEVLEIRLSPEQAVLAETGSMLYMSDGIEMRTNISGGLWSGIKRKMSGEKFFVTTFVNTGRDYATVGVASYYPGKIHEIDLKSYGEVFYCQSRCFLCAESSIDISIGFVKKLGAGIFAGSGFVLQKLKGDGQVFVHAGGSVISRELLPGESIRVDTGCLLGFSKTIDYDITLVNGVMNPIFGGEGIFFAKLTGPGTVLLQSLPFSRLAENIGMAMAELAAKGR